MAYAFIVDPAEVLGSEETCALGKALIATRKDGGNYLSELTVSFLRPRARRREITARPSAVFMRVRKPCFLARFRLFGWKVRFGILVQSFSIVQFGLRIKFESALRTVVEYNPAGAINVGVALVVQPHVRQAFEERARQVELAGNGLLAAAIDIPESVLIPHHRLAF